MAHFDFARTKGRLLRAGAAEPVADATADVIREAVAPLDRVATREDLLALRADFQALRADIQHDLRTLALQICGFAVAVAAVAVAVVKLA